MKTNQQGIDIIKKWEGFRAKPYYCPAGVLTIGYGSTGSRVKPGTILNRETAEQWLVQDCKKFEEINKSGIKVPVSSNQFSALISFTYNVGGGAFTGSTLLRKLNSKDYQGACNELDRWVNGGGRKLPGLVKRRNDEQALFNKPDGHIQDPKSEGVAIASNKILITHNTWGKQEVVGHEHQTEGETKVRLYEGSELPFLANKSEGGHIRFTFGHGQEDIKLAGRNTWLLWGEHFRFVNQATEEEPSQADTLAERIASACEEKGYPLDKSVYNLVGISGLFPKSSRDEAYGIDTTPDKWNDSVLILAHEGVEWDILAFYRATTEPGRHYVFNPLNPNGGACLDWGFHKGLWRFGQHRGYRALSQAGEVLLRRDKNRNHRRDDVVTVERGNGINLHTSKTTGWRGSYSETSIGRWSAGCVVIPDPAEFRQCLSILEKSPQYRQNCNTLFDFRLLDHGWI